MDGPLRTLLWHVVGPSGAQWCELAREQAGWRITGTALTVDDGEPILARYDIALDQGWATRDVQVTARAGAAATRRLHLTVDPAQCWSIERDPVGAPDNAAAFSGLFDVDLSLAPATNTLPIRRLAPAVGEAVDVTAVWVRFPELTIERLPQRYIRLDERRYRYESNGGAFVAEIEVDELGLLVSYEGLWQRIAESSV